MDQQYYREYYTLERSHWWFVARGKMLKNHLERALRGRKDLNILNIGAATGHTSEWLEAFGKVKSVEYDPECYAFTKSMLSIDIDCASILELPYPDEHFDLVCAFDVIEHVEDDKLAVSEMRRVCKKGGLISVTVPAFLFLWSAHDDVNHHFRRYTGANLKALLAAGNKPVFHTYFNFWLFFPIAFFRLLSRILPLKKKDREDAGSDFFVMNSPFMNKVFYQIFYSENVFLSRHISLPVGVSILSTWEKGD